MSLVAIAAFLLVAGNLWVWRYVVREILPLVAVKVSTGGPALSVTAPAPTVATRASSAWTEAGVPVQLTIPSLGLNVAVEQTALAADGSMGVPKKPRNVAWYELGPRPGESGNAVIAGHVNWKRGATAAFADLRLVKPGDQVTVKDSRGISVTFVVRESRMYAADADASAIFAPSDNRPHLNLITCDGSWDEKTEQYSERLVVFADKSER